MNFPSWLHMTISGLSGIRWNVAVKRHFWTRCKLRMGVKDEFLAWFNMVIAEFAAHGSFECLVLMEKRFKSGTEITSGLRILVINFFFCCLHVVIWVIEPNDENMMLISLPNFSFICSTCCSVLHYLVPQPEWRNNQVLASKNVIYLTKCLNEFPLTLYYRFCYFACLRK